MHPREYYTLTSQLKQLLLLYLKGFYQEISAVTLLGEGISLTLTLRPFCGSYSSYGRPFREHYSTVDSADHLCLEK